MPKQPSRFSISTVCARAIEKDLDDLFERLPELEESAAGFADAIDADEDKIYLGQVAIQTAGIVFAAAHEDESEELANLDASSEEKVPAWVNALVKLYNHGDIEPCGNPTRSMLDWARQMMKARPTPSGADAFEALRETMGIEITDKKKPPARADVPAAGEPRHRVRHAKFGLGTVVSASEGNLEIVFDSGDRKRLKREFVRDL